MNKLAGLGSLIGTLALGTLVVVACGDDVVTQTAPDAGSSGSTSGASSSGTSGTGASSSGASSSSGSSADGASAYAAADCAHLAKCSHSYFLQYFGDDATCQAYVQAALTKSSGLPGFATTSDQYQACAAKLSAAACGETFAECEWPGTLADDAPCGEAIQCKGGACVKTAFAACGKCAAEGVEGAECGTGRAPCKGGLYCTPSTQKCSKLLAEGDTCQAGGTACGVNLKCISKKCTKPLADGADCTGATGSCAITSFCSADHKCQPLASKPANVGDACDDLAVGCTLSSCDIQLKPTAKCVALVPEGGDCGNRANCQIGFTCRTGKCVKDDPSTCK